MVAEGAAHIYPRMVPCCEWDTAAADIIVREAGGVVLQVGGGGAGRGRGSAGIGVGRRGGGAMLEVVMRLIACLL